MRDKNQASTPDSITSVLNEDRVFPPSKEFALQAHIKSMSEFTNKVGAVAEEIGHHPDIYLTWGKVKINIYTHKVDGLTENDFVLAAKIEKMIQDECGKKIKSV